MSPREFAIKIVERLQAENYEALWAGGCVRDELLGLKPKDYDVATSATPDQVRSLFGHNRTIAIGAAFGVITVIGTKESGNIEVATFRRDSIYSDGRRPDSVEFTDAQEDALRRDFTINGMFFDPVQEKTIDFVEGKADIECQIVRAIGNPEERIDEDKLRMLRAVRFAATYEFSIETETLLAIQRHAPEIRSVSPERIGAEMRRMLKHPNRSQACSLLKDSGLLNEILPEGHSLYQNRANFKTRLRWLRELGGEATFEQAAAILLSTLLKKFTISEIAGYWKLSNSEVKTIDWIESHLMTLSRGHQTPWSTIQPLLIQEPATQAIHVGKVMFGDSHEGIRFCADRLNWSKERLNPDPLIDGADLKRLRIPAGPIYKEILDLVRAKQLDGEIASKEQAVRLADEVVNQN